MQALFHPPVQNNFVLAHVRRDIPADLYASAVGKSLLPLNQANQRLLELCERLAASYAKAPARALRHWQRCAKTRRHLQSVPAVARVARWVRSATGLSLSDYLWREEPALRGAFESLSPRVMAPVRVDVFCPVDARHSADTVFGEFFHDRAHVRFFERLDLARTGLQPIDTAPYPSVRLHVDRRAAREAPRDFQAALGALRASLDAQATSAPPVPFASQWHRVAFCSQGFRLVKEQLALVTDLARFYDPSTGFVWRQRERLQSIIAGSSRTRRATARI